MFWYDLYMVVSMFYNSGSYIVLELVQCVMFVVGVYDDEFYFVLVGYICNQVGRCIDFYIRVDFGDI